MEEYHSSVRAGRLAKQLRDLELALSTLACARALASNGPPVREDIVHEAGGLSIFKRNSETLGPTSNPAEYTRSFRS